MSKINLKQKSTKETFNEDKVKEIDDYNCEINLTPRFIKQILDEDVVGQEEAKKRVSLEMYKQLLRINGYDIKKSNILMTGLSGTGKTYMWEILAKRFNIPIYIQDCTKLTCSGYVGEDIEGCLKGLLRNANYNLEKAEYGIVVLDEIDKASRKSENPSITRDVSGEGVQQGLLKMLEGKMCEIPEGQRRHPNEECTILDTTNILFVGCGAFENIEDYTKQRLTKAKNGQTMGFGATIEIKKEVELNELRSSINEEDLVRFGMLPEFIGRFPILLNLNDLKREDLIKILKLGNGIFKDYINFFETLNKTLVIKNEIYEHIADKAINSSTGARELKKIIENILFEVSFLAPENKSSRVVLNKKFLEKIS